MENARAGTGAAAPTFHRRTLGSSLKHHIGELISQALATLERDGVIPADHGAAVKIDRTRQKEHGDFACNIAMVLAKPARKAPRELAGAIIEALPESAQVAKVEIAGPGFINFYLSPSAWHALVPAILAAGAEFGRSRMGQGRRVILEFVSANPTGPLHVGHGRGAAYGDALGRILRAAGYELHAEYYVNDAGRQMDILATSVWLRYLELCGEEYEFPSNAYKGDYIWDIGATLHRENGERLRRSAEDVFVGLPSDVAEEHIADPEAHLDGLIARGKELLGETDYAMVHKLATDTLVDDIRRDLKEFGVEYDRWFSERSLTDSGEVAKAIALMKEHGYLYEKDGALWFRSTDLGDEKDRVVVRDNGVTTYFASDIAYHLDKFERGFEHLINIWGADHHGYVPRVKAALSAMGRNPDDLTVLLVQFAILYRGKERVSMSTRGGQFVTLRELRKETGNDAARFFYALRKCEQHMDFDLELAKSQSLDNPVYYIQYAHARICSVFRQLEEKGMDTQTSDADFAVLTETHEDDLLNALSRYPEVVEQAAASYEPHLVAYYLQELATAFHTYYNAHQFLVEDAALRNARLALIAAVRQVIANGLDLLGVSAPESM
jgi:arginyl-tRNA synthetase